MSELPAEGATLSETPYASVGLFETIRIVVASTFETIRIVVASTFETIHIVVASTFDVVASIFDVVASTFDIFDIVASNLCRIPSLRRVLASDFCDGGLALPPIRHLVLGGR